MKYSLITCVFLIMIFSCKDNIIQPIQPEPQEPEQKEEPGKKKSKKHKFLDSYCMDLTGRARAGKLDKVIGRDVETERVIQILNRRQKNNPCLIGEPGVGKTAVVEGLAQKIIKGEVPEVLKDKITEQIEIIGEVRTRNLHDNGQNHCELYVFVTDTKPYTIDKNIVELDGFICKKPIYRTTPFGREITDILIAVNRAYNKSGYKNN